MANLYFDLEQNGYEFSVSIQSVMKCLKLANEEAVLPTISEEMYGEICSMYGEEKNDRETQFTGKITENFSKDGYSMKFIFEYADLKFAVELKTLLLCMRHAYRNNMLPKSYNLRKWLDVAEGVYLR